MRQHEHNMPLHSRYAFTAAEQNMRIATNLAGTGTTFCLTMLPCSCHTARLMGTVAHGQTPTSIAQQLCRAVTFMLLNYQHDRYMNFQGPQRHNTPSTWG